MSEVREMTVKELLGLLEWHAHNRMATSLALAVDDLFVGQHRSESRTPVDQRIGPVDQAVAVDDVGALSRALGWPFELKKLSFRGPEIPVLSKRLLQDGADLLEQLGHGGKFQASCPCRRRSA